MTAALSDFDMQIKRKILKRRWQLITSGVDCKDVKIKGLKPYMKGEIVETDKNWQLKKCIKCRRSALFNFDKLSLHFTKN